MNPLIKLQQIRQRVTWNTKRLQQFADRAGLSLLQAQVLEQSQGKDHSFDHQVDRMVDPVYKLENCPV